MVPKHAAPADRRAYNYAFVLDVKPAPERKRLSWWPKGVAVALGIALAAAATATWSLAQRRESPRILVPPMISAQPASQVAVRIEIGQPDLLPRNSFVRLRGFPNSVSLTEGHAIAPGAWAIPLFGLRTLKAIVPAGVSGQTDILISLVGVDGNTIAETRTTFVIAAPAPQDRIPPQPPPRFINPNPPVALPPVSPVRPPPVAQPAPPRGAPGLSTEDRERAQRMLAQGNKNLDQGNIGAARLFFQRAWEANLAEGALAMGTTYDPTELGRVVGLTPDVNEARKWYERARDLGSQEATTRLRQLGGR
ncbi:MAG TPA: hypothetical protein VFZ16_05745 [Hyphomicrobiaceae bacterium]|nr:hypothetical protein [Hyphomicrobiaceae bacterium]